MKNLFLENLDINDYLSNSEFEKVAELVQPLSNKAKTANVQEIDADSIVDTNFAVVLRSADGSYAYKYACFTPELTEMNMACLVDKLYDLPEAIVKTAAANLTYAAKNFNLSVPGELKKFASNKFINRLVDVPSISNKKVEKETIKTAEKVSTNFALGDKYPIDTKSEMVKAAKWFDRNHNKLSVEEILEFTDNMVKQANVLKIDFKLDENYKSIEKYASLDKENFNPDIYNNINIRKNYLSDDTSNDEYKALYTDIVRKADEIGVEKTACLLEYADKESGLDSLYGTIMDPLTAVCGNVFSKVGGLSIDGKMISLPEIRKIPHEDLTELVGNDGIKELKSADGLEVLASLPKPIREEILTLIEKYNA